MYNTFTTKLAVDTKETPNQLTVVSKSFRDSIPVIRYAVTAYCNDTIYIFGGFIEDSISNTLYTIKPTIGTITKVDTPLSHRMEAQMCVYNDELYVFGGRNDNEYPSDCWKFNTLMGTWTQLAGNVKGRAGFSMNIANGKLFVFGGYRKKKFLNSMAVYDISRNIWHEAVFEGAPECRANHAACVIDFDAHRLRRKKQGQGLRRRCLL